MVSFEEAFKQSLEYFNGDELAANVFLGKYALKTPEGDILEPTPDFMHKRLAKELSRIEAKYPSAMSEKEIYELLKGFKKICLQGSPMSGIGNPYYVQSLGNCFVLESPLDSYGGICKIDQELVQLSKRRCGVGFDISNLRPSGAPTKNAAKSSTGIIPFMERYSNSIKEVGQSARRGALLMSIDSAHYEVESFITAKKDNTKVTGANISVKLSDAFMRAVKEDKDWSLQWPVNTNHPQIKKIIKAKQLWDLIISNAHLSGDPGVFFWDVATQYSPADCYKVVDKDFENQTSNPCGEIIMGIDSCRLTLINTLGYVENPYTEQAHFNWKKFSEDAFKMQKLMDDIVDLELEALDKIISKVESDPEPQEIKAIELNMWKRFKKNCINGRRTGSGLTALGDTIAALGMKYGSEDSIRMTEHIYRTLSLACYKATVVMARERGAFPVFSKEIEQDNAFLQRIWEADKELHKEYLKYGRRNVALLTTAPAGSVSILTQTTSGIEPVFRLKYTRRKKINPNDKNVKVDFVDNVGERWQEFNVYHHGLKQWMDITSKSSIEESPYWKSTSDDIDWVASVDIQAAAQKWVDHSISKTINVPEDTSKEVIEKIYLRAFETKCKGVTVYREGSKAGVLVSSEQKNKQDGTTFKENHAPKRPQELLCDIHHMSVNGEKWTIFVGLLENKPFEIMGGLSNKISLPKRVKQGKMIKHNGEINPAVYDFSYDFEKGPDDEVTIKDIGNIFENKTNEAFGRMVSLSLRHGCPLVYVVEQISKGADKESDMFSFSKAIARVLKNYVKDGTKTKSKCPECGGTELAYQEGCLRCLNEKCGYSKCG